MTDPLLQFRAEFPILDRTTYLISNSLGAMPQSARQKMADFTTMWAEEGIRAWGKGWWELTTSVGDEIAPLIGAGPGEVAMLPNVTIAQAMIASALDYTPERNAIVMTGLDFPSVRYAYDGLVTRLGARIVEVPSDDGVTIDTERVVKAIDERTKLVAISYVLFRSAYILDVEPIIARAREVGALVCLDAYHATGIIPVNVKKLGVDFLTSGVLKWMCGGPGGCFLYASPEMTRKYAPALTGWQAHARPFAFENEMEYAPGIQRWLSAEPSISVMYHAPEGVKVLKRAGMENIRAKSMRQTARLIDLADERGYKVTAPRDPARRGGTVAFDVPNAYEVAQTLLSRDILIDYRPGAGIRVAPHFYNTDEEVESVVAGIDEILAKGDWKEYAGKRTVVT